MAYKLLCTYLFLSFCLHSYAVNKQDTILYSSLNEKVNLHELKKFKYFKITPNSAYLDVKTIAFKNNLDSGTYESGYAYWLKATIFNDTEANVRLYFYTGSVQLVDLYVQNNRGSLVWKSSSGYYMPTQYLESTERQDYLSMPLLKDQIVDVYIRLYNLTNLPVQTNLRLEKPEFHFETMKEKRKRQLNETYMSIIFCSSLTFLLFFMFFTYIKNKQKVYLYFCLYLLGAVLYACSKLNTSTLLGSWINYAPYLRTLLNEPSQFLFFAAYNLFVIELLDVKEKDRLLYKILFWLSIVYIVYAISHFTYLAFSYDIVTRDKLFVIARIFLFPVNTILIIRTYLTLRKSLTYKYFFTGVMIYFTSAFVAALTDYLYRTSEKLMSGTIFQAGIMAEALCFAFAIGYRTKLIDDERKLNQEKYIAQMKINQQMYVKINLKLEEEIEARTTEIISYQNQIQEQKKAELQLIYEKKISEIENVALRSQMNPHFLFNSLNAIKFFILSNQNKQAANYLNRFSKLIRLILEHSKENLISLSDELTALKLYLEIESTRFDDNFSYHIHIEDSVNTNDLLVPPLLLQPFVENAIWHGLLPKKHGEKELNIKILKENNDYLFLIEDNGIGRILSNEKKIKDKRLYKSLGMQITQDRIDLYNNNAKGNIKLTIIDLPDHLGTRVQISYQL